MRNFCLLLMFLMGLFRLSAQDLLHYALSNKCHWEHYRKGDTVFWESKGCCAGFWYTDFPFFEDGCGDASPRLYNLKYWYNERTRRAVFIRRDSDEPDVYYTVCHLTRGKLHGMYAGYNDYGCNYEHYLNNKKNGFAAWKRADGRVERQAFYIQDRLWGIVKDMYYEENTKVVEFYLNGRPLGVWVKPIDKTRPMQ